MIDLLTLGTDKVRDFIQLLLVSFFGELSGLDGIWSCLVNEYQDKCHLQIYQIYAVWLVFLLSRVTYKTHAVVMYHAMVRDTGTTNSVSIMPVKYNYTIVSIVCLPVGPVRWTRGGRVG